MTKHDKLLLLILDGWGLYNAGHGNAISQSKLPHYQELISHHPFAQLSASGQSVGLPPGQIGTSEVNHLTIGAGRILYQNLVRINNAIADKTFFKNGALVKACAHAVKNKSSLHIVGLYSSGGVHSQNTHIKALVELATQQHVPAVFLHLFTDGRDTLPTTGRESFRQLEYFLKQINLGTIATITGRYFGMDRDENWGRTNRAFEALTHLSGAYFPTVESVFSHAYSNNLTDEYIEPAILTHDKKACIQENDAVIFANFRADRMRQLVHLTLKSSLKNLFVASMTIYQDEFTFPSAFNTLEVANHLVEILEAHQIPHHHISETEKYAHVTYFFNGRREGLFPSEKRVHIKSNSEVRTHDLYPQMRAPEITQAITTLMEKEEKGVIIANFANADIVGHTANIPAAIAACQAIDVALGHILKIGMKNNWATIITADHGNAEMLIDPQTGGAHTAHTLNPVPFILASAEKYVLNRNEGQLSDVAPTILKLMDLDKPREMTGKPLC